MQFTGNIDLSLQTQMLELFSGQGKVSGVFRRSGVATVSYDIEMFPDKRTMDFLSPSGFAYLSLYYVACPPPLLPPVCHIQPPRLAMTCILQEGPNALNLVAPDCGSFSLVSRGTFMRSGINPLGRQGLPFVFRGNGSISRWENPVFKFMVSNLKTLTLKEMG